MSFAVKPPTLDAASDAFGDLREAMSPLTLACFGPMQPGRGGFMIDGFATEVETIRQKLIDQYGFDGPCRTFSITMAQELRGLAYDYREADSEAAERSDALMAKVGGPDVQIGTSSWNDDVVSDGNATVSVGDIEGIVADPTSSFEDYGQWKEITGTVSEIAGMGYLTDWLPNFGFDDPIPRILEKVDGDWEALGRSIGAIKAVASAWSQLAEDIAGIWDALSKDWSGNAANACFNVLQEFQQAASDHGDSLRKQAEHLHRLAQSTYYEVDAIRLAITMLGDLIPNPLDLGWWADNLLPNKVAGRIIEYIGHIDAILGLCGEPFKFLEEVGFDESEISYDFPSLSYTAPEVPHP